jgi:hypothetical protein
MLLLSIFDAESHVMPDPPAPSFAEIAPPFAETNAPLVQPSLSFAYCFLQ